MRTRLRRTGKQITAALALLVALQAPGGQGANIEAELERARIALDEAAERLAELHQHHYSKHSGAKRAMLGILLGDEPNQDGVELVGVSPGGGAKVAGLEAGDILVRIGDTSLSDADDPMQALVDFMKAVVPGDTVEVAYVRDDELHEAVITTVAHAKIMSKVIYKDFSKELAQLGELEELEALGALGDLDVDLESFDNHAAFSLRGSDDGLRLQAVDGTLASYFDIDAGVIVLAAPEGSALQGGDVLLSVAGQDITKPSDVRRALRANAEDEIEVTLQRKGLTESVRVAREEIARAGPRGSKVIRLRMPDKHEADDSGDDEDKDSGG